MNKRGFTVVELLAVIVITALVLAISIPNIVSAYKNSRLKAEAVFVNRISQMVDSYVTLKSDDLVFSNYGSGKTFVKPSEDDRTIKLSYSNKTIQDLINEKIMNRSDYVNPNNKDASCNVNARVEVYKDSDFVYCHKIKASSLGCITTDYIDTYLEGNSESYIVDTCVWREE